MKVENTIATQAVEKSLAGSEERYNLVCSFAFMVSFYCIKYESVLCCRF